MSERRQAAWDEAQRRYPTGDRQAGFVSGAAWADDNPQPRTITRAQFEEAFEARFTPDPVVGLNVLGFLRELGIEVRND